MINKPPTHNCHEMVPARQKHEGNAGVHPLHCRDSNIMKILN